MRFSHENIQPGMTVRDRLGEKVGKVQSCDAEGFLIEKGLLSSTDYRARYDVVSDLREGEVWLTKSVAEFGRPVGRGTEAGRGTDARREALRGEGRDEIRVPLAEEELEATKRVRDAGEVRLRKEVQTEQREVSVPVTSERVVVERVPASERSARAGEARFEEESVSMPIREEEVEIRKRPVVKDEVRLRKERGVQEQRFADTVRKETAEIEDEEGHVTRAPEPGGYKAPPKD